MESKYYTPTIEEFHIGFECEWRRNEEDWYGGKINSSIELYDAAIEYEAGENQTYEYRVKYLDKEDIESFGFGSYIPPHEYDHTWIKDNYILKAWFNHELPTIRIMYIPSTIIFHGAIKNKSELKILLKQLGIE